MLALCGLAGCGGESAESRLKQAIPNREPVVPVSGTILVDGEPVAELTVRLVREGATAPTTTDPKTLTNDEGIFRFTTYLEGDGVPPGDYLVLIEQLTRMGTSGWSGPDKLNNHYNHLTEPAAKISVEQGTPINDLEIVLEVAGKSPKPAPPYQAIASGKPVKGQIKGNR